MKITELSSEEAVTIFSSVKILREHPTKALTSIDLENYISQAVWKFFDKCRGEAAERLGVGEMELVLSDVRVLGVKVDGHQVINPTGFTGRELEISLSLTVVKKGRPADNDYLVEAGSMRAYILSRLLDLNRGFYIESGSDRTSVFCINGSDVRYFSGFDWGENDVAEAFKEVLKVDRDILRGVYAKYASGDVSERLSKKMDKVFYKNLTAFVNGALMNVRNAGGLRSSSAPVMYFNPRFPIPAGVYRKHFSFGKRKLKFQKPEEPLNIEEFMDENIHGVYEELNELARRRIKWLMPNS